MQIGVRLDASSSPPNAKVRGAIDTIQSGNKGESFREGYLNQTNKPDAATPEMTEADFLAPPSSPQPPLTEGADPPADMETIDTPKTSGVDIDTTKDGDLNLAAINVDETDPAKRVTDGDALPPRTVLSTQETAASSSTTDVGVKPPIGQGEIGHKGRADQNITSVPAQEAAIDGPQNNKSMAAFTPNADTAAATNAANTSPLQTPQTPQSPTSFAPPAGTVNAPTSSFNQIASDPQQISAQHPTMKLQLDTNTAGKISQLISVISQSEGDQQNRVYIQLDPPELGRLALDFKFDTQGLQQIIITSETQEALKRMRGQHFELVQALQENGMGESTVSYQQSHDNRGQSRPNYDRDENDQSVSSMALSSPQTIHTYHLNMRENLIANNSLNIII